MNAYDQLLAIAQQQLDAVGRGNLGLAIELLEAREQLVHAAPAPQTADRELIEQVLRIDAELNSALRDGMSALRDELLGTQRARVALQGYRPRLRHSAMALDAAR